MEVKYLLNVWKQLSNESDSSRPKEWDKILSSDDASKRVLNARFELGRQSDLYRRASTFPLAAVSNAPQIQPYRFSQTAGRKGILLALKATLENDLKALRRDLKAVIKSMIHLASIPKVQTFLVEELNMDEDEKAVEFAKLLVTEPGTTIDLRQAVQMNAVKLLVDQFKKIFAYEPIINDFMERLSIQGLQLGHLYGSDHAVGARVPPLVPFIQPPNETTRAIGLVNASMVLGLCALPVPTPLTIASPPEFKPYTSIDEEVLSMAYEDVDETEVDLTIAKIEQKLPVGNSKWCKWTPLVDRDSKTSVANSLDKPDDRRGFEMAQAVILDVIASSNDDHPAGLCALLMNISHTLNASYLDPQHTEFVRDWYTLPIRTSSKPTLGSKLPFVPRGQQIEIHQRPGLMEAIAARQEDQERKVIEALASWRSANRARKLALKAKLEAEARAEVAAKVVQETLDKAVAAAAAAEEQRKLASGDAAKEAEARAEQAKAEAEAAKREKEEADRKARLEKARREEALIIKAEAAANELLELKTAEKERVETAQANIQALEKRLLEAQAVLARAGVELAQAQEAQAAATSMADSPSLSKEVEIADTALGNAEAAFTSAEGEVAVLSRSLNEAEQDNVNRINVANKNIQAAEEESGTAEAAVNRGTESSATSRTTQRFLVPGMGGGRSSYASLRRSVATTSALPSNSSNRAAELCTTYSVDDTLTSTPPGSDTQPPVVVPTASSSKPPSTDGLLPRKYAKDVIDAALHLQHRMHLNECEQRAVKTRLEEEDGSPNAQDEVEITKRRKIVWDDATRTAAISGDRLYSFYRQLSGTAGESMNAVVQIDDSQYQRDMVRSREQATKLSMAASERFAGLIESTFAGLFRQSGLTFAIGNPSTEVSIVSGNLRKQLTDLAQSEVGGLFQKSVELETLIESAKGKLSLTELVRQLTAIGDVLQRSTYMAAYNPTSTLSIETVAQPSNSLVLNVRDVATAAVNIAYDNLERELNYHSHRMRVPLLYELIEGVYCCLDPSPLLPTPHLRKSRTPFHACPVRVPFWWELRRFALLVERDRT